MHNDAYAREFDISLYLQVSAIKGAGQNEPRGMIKGALLGPM